MDFAITDAGDLQVSSSGDLATTIHQYSPALQLAYISVLTELGDFTPYPTLGSEIYKLWGLPNTQSVASKGEEELYKALAFGGKLSNASIKIKSVPTSANTIRFDIDIQFSRSQSNIITLEQKISSIRG
jgi:hypothetical protein